MVPMLRQFILTDTALLVRSTHRLLFRRLVGMAVLVSIMAAGGFYFAERIRFAATLRDNVLLSAARLQTLAQADLDAPGPVDGKRLQGHLEKFLLYGQQQQLSLAAAIEFKDVHGRTLAYQHNPEILSAQELGELYNASRFRWSGDGVGVQHELAFLDARPFLHILIPFTSSSGETVAYGDGLFSIRQDVFREANTRMGLAIALAVCIVLGTAGLLYPVIFRMMRQLHASSMRLLEANLETLNILGRAAAKRDSDLDTHNYRVTIYAVRIAERMGLDRRRMRGLIKGAFLHDVGKIGIRDALLHKPGGLTPEEFAEVRQHVQHGRDIVARTEWLHDALDVIGGHHEHFDGTGYDQQLQGEAIPLTARIFAVSDVFDALATARPYKEAFAYDVTVAIMKDGRGSHFDPQVLDAFWPIAADLHHVCSTSSSQELDAVLRDLCAQYFSSDIEELLLPMRLGAVPAGQAT